MAEHVYDEHIDISAPPEAVWAVLTDVERWPSWTASMRSVRHIDDGPIRVGSRVHIEQPRLPAMTWTVDRLEPGRSFSWVVSSPGADGMGDHRIEATVGGSRVFLTIRQSGPLAGVARVLFGRVTRRYMRMEAEGLKREVESRRR